MNAPFIVFEGGEGSGKSTQSRLLGETLRARDVAAINTREPGGSPGAEAIRNLVVQGDVGRWSPKSEMLLFAAARVDHIQRVIMPSLAAGTVVICDRFVDSTLAYQGNGDATRAALIRQLHTSFCDNLQPDLTFLLDVDPEIGLARSGKRLAAEASGESRFEAMAADFHRRIQACFHERAEMDPSRYHVIDATRSPADIQAEILEIAVRRFADRFTIRKAA